MARKLTLGGMLVLLVAIIGLFPILLRLVVRITGGEGFVAVAPGPEGTVTGGSQAPPSAPGYPLVPSSFGSGTPTSLPCKVNASGQVCPEGTFCDGYTQQCTALTASMSGPGITGYFS